MKHSILLKVNKTNGKAIKSFRNLYRVFQKYVSNFGETFYSFQDERNEPRENEPESVLSQIIQVPSKRNSPILIPFSLK